MCFCMDYDTKQIMFNYEYGALLGRNMHINKGVFDLIFFFSWFAHGRWCPTNPPTHFNF